MITKLISDKNDLQSLYGRISIGFLIVQDFIVIILLLVISSLNTGINPANLAFTSMIKGIIAIISLFLLTVALPRGNC